jgi:hypothetical protein
MLVGQQYLCNLFWFVSQCSQSIHIFADALTDIDRCCLLWCTIRETCRQTGVNQYHLLACINEIVLQTATIADILVKYLLSFLAAKSKMVVLSFYFE